MPVDIEWHTNTVRLLKNATSMEDLRDVLTAAYRQIGVDYWLVSIQTADSLYKPTCIVINNYPDEFWLEYIISNWILYDPIAHYSQTHDLPKVWTLKGWADIPGHKWKDDQKYYGYETGLYFDLVKEFFGKCCGLVLPLHCANGVRGCVNLTVATSSYARTIPLFTTISVLAQSIRKDICVALSRLQNIQPLSLTKREQEVLFWVGEGKKGSEICDILRIKRSTVEKYFRSSQRKLRADSRQEALTKAVNLGLVAPVLHCANIVFTMSQNKTAAGREAVQRNYCPPDPVGIPPRIGRQVG